MTLYRQLFLFLLIFIILLFSGTWLVKLNSTRSFLTDQLESHAQDTATSLGLSISPHMVTRDMAVVESMINAVFDRGYYRVIRLTAVDGTVLVNRTLSVNIETVPEWFIRFVPIETPRTTAMVMAGWNKAGNLYVESHPGYAYKTLWEATVQTTLWFFISGCVVIIAGSLGLHYLLRPLKRVEEQANALCNKQYTMQKRLPRTRELRRMVEAMNRMTRKVKTMFEEQAQIVEKVQKIAFQDALTGLGNRRYLVRQVNAALSLDERCSSGAFFLVQIHELEKINQEKGYKAGDLLIRKAAEKLCDCCKQIPNTVLARLTGGDFALLFPDITPDDAQLVARDIMKDLAALSLEKMTLSENVGHLGGITYNSRLEFGQLLGMADTVLRGVEKKGPNKYSIQDNSLVETGAFLGELQWKEMLETVLEKEALVLFGQNVVACSNKNNVIHVELFSRITGDDGRLINAAVFIPMAERLGLISHMDRIVIKKSMQVASKNIRAKAVAVNISPVSLLDIKFCDWLHSLLQGLPAGAPKLFFEFPEFGAVNNIELVNDFSRTVRKFGHGIGLDHFGSSFSNFGYLKDLQPDYVKIDRAFIGEWKSSRNVNQFFIDSLCTVAHSIDVRVIAEGVENEEQEQNLQGHNLDAMQGFYISEPGPLNGEGVTS